MTGLPLVLKVARTRGALQASQQISPSKNTNKTEECGEKVPQGAKTQRLPLHTHLDIVSRTVRACVRVFSIGVVFSDGKQRLSEALKPPPANAK